MDTEAIDPVELVWLENGGFFFTTARTNFIGFSVFSFFHEDFCRIEKERSGNHGRI